MASFLLPALLALSSAQLAASQSDQTTWGAVVFTLYGDATPMLTTPRPSLTPLGAQQAMLAGSAIRTRYISGASDNITASHPVSGISTSYLDDSQLSILASSEQPIVASAQAFLQGLYPPIDSPSMLQPGALLANGSAVEMPILNGYQYPRIEAISASDFNYVWYACYASSNPNHAMLTIPGSPATTNAPATPSPRPTTGPPPSTTRPQNPHGPSTNPSSPASSKASSRTPWSPTTTPTRYGNTRTSPSSTTPPSPPPSRLPTSPAYAPSPPSAPTT